MLNSETVYTDNQNRKCDSAIIQTTVNEMKGEIEEVIGLTKAILKMSDDEEDMQYRSIGKALMRIIRDFESNIYSIENEIGDDWK